ncbi:MAG TPA: ImmA/IrrE family metallo-endopeptidase [Methylomirabilota bacterium]|jgi:hypothetical protein|nr:ImmA/IrrE family metallo-endopeptidase [Methylomirabilota bacterium]
MRELRAGALAALLVVVVAFIPTGVAPAQPAQPSLGALAGPLYQQLAQIKGIAAPGPPPPILVKSREETRRFIEQELDRRYSPTRLEQERKGMIAWGLIPADYDLRRLFLELMEEQVAAYYDPRAKVMVVGDWLPPEQQQTALMHELVHALQDREISLDDYITPHPGQGDQVLARQALMEGEAVALTLELVLRAQGKDLASLPDLAPLQGLVSAAGVGPTISSAPKFLRDLLLFPYVDGLNFVFQLRKRQPWSAMTALYRDPPRSTTQIMNPGKRLLTREDPIPISLPDLGTLSPGARVITEDELGEFALGAVLALHLGEPGGRAAAAGWRGDRYRVWESSDGRLLIAYLVAMESEKVATALALSYTKLLEKRHPMLAGKGVPGRTGAIVTWRDGVRGFAVEKRGAEVLVLEQLPAMVIDAARETIWRTRPAR